MQLLHINIDFQARNEITITPVGTQYETAPSKGRSTVSNVLFPFLDKFILKLNLRQVAEHFNRNI